MHRWLPRFLIAASLALHAFTAACYICQPDTMAAFTAYPIWIWCTVGLIFPAAAFVGWRAPLSLMLVILWTITFLVGSDEAHSLTHIGYEKPEIGPAKPYKSQDILRVCTLNWGTHYQTEAGMLAQAEIVASYHPDIVFLQEIHPWQARIIADKLYSGGGDYRTGADTAIITRWKVHLVTHTPMRHSQHVTLMLPKNRTLDCVNFHLSSAISEMRLWKKSTWKNHSASRELQRREVQYSLTRLQNTTAFPTNPVICAGHFNATASDPLHDLLRIHFNDSFSEAGTGWPNTWQSSFPLHRIDYIYTSPLLKAVRSHTVQIPRSNHHMVVSDFLLIP